MSFLIALIVLFLNSSTVFAQDVEEGISQKKGFKLAGIPNLNYNSDDGYGYGARLSLFNHGDGGYSPYFYTAETDILVTTGGQRRFIVFFDSPYFLNKNQRLIFELRYHKHNYSEYYGIGNDTEYHEEFTDSDNPVNFINKNYYRFRRNRSTFWINYQRFIGSFKTLAGFGISNTDIELHNGITLLRTDKDITGRNGGFTNYLKVGIIYDTRDFEPSPSKGDWTDVILELSGKAIGSSYDYTRFTFTNRHYFKLMKNVVLAERFIFEKNWGDIPFYEMAFFESSYKIEEGVGGAKSVRGLLKNRLFGPAKLFGNLELRWRLFDFRMMKQNFYFSLNCFSDFGRVWKKDEHISFTDFHLTQGGGIHIGWNENFIFAVDAATSDEVNMAIYIGVGYLY